MTLGGDLAIARVHWRSPRRVRRILLMSLPAVVAPGERSPKHENVMHLGLAYVGGALRASGSEVGFLDCFAESNRAVRPAESPEWVEFGLSDEEIVARVSAFSPDVIGLSVPFSCQHYLARRVAKQLKAACPGVPIVAGGNHVTAVPREIDPTAIDCVVTGEGERAMVDLVRAVGEGTLPRRPDGVDGPAVWRGQRVEDLDVLPLPAIDLLPLGKLWGAGPRWINMIASRGCPYDCNFCSIHTVMGRGLRRRSVDSVLDEMARWRRQIGAQEVYFEDDNLTVDTAWAKQLFEKVTAAKFGMRLHARNGLRADAVDRELLLLMKAAGFQDFMVSPETGSQSTLDEIVGKHMTLGDVEDAVTLAGEVGLGVNAFFVLGLPGETWDDLRRTRDYARHLKRLGVVGFWFSTASPYPGTRLFEEVVRDGLLNPETLDYRRLRTTDYAMKHPLFDAAELKAFREECMREFAPPRRSTIRKAGAAARLLARDPRFFWIKAKHKAAVAVRSVSTKARVGIGAQLRHAKERVSA